ncbi:MAG: response regulator transcription factor [Chloroflexi bacterium]|nr:response regulator transcription factor [Chloroflexota bacterium]
MVTELIRGERQGVTEQQNVTYIARVKGEHFEDAEGDGQIPADDHRLQDGTSRPVLTRRELEVLALVARGMQNRHIGATLYISERTVKYHVSNLLTKLHAANRMEAVIVARQMGLLQV